MDNYDNVDTFISASLDPPSFLPAEICLPPSQLYEYLPASTKPLWPDRFISPLSEIAVADAHKTHGVRPLYKYLLLLLLLLVVLL